MKQETRLGSAKFAAWHEASVSNGLFVHTGDNVEIEGAIEVHHWIAGANTVIFPHTLVVTGKRLEGPRDRYLPFRRRHQPRAGHRLQRPLRRPGFATRLRRHPGAQRSHAHHPDQRDLDRARRIRQRLHPQHRRLVGPQRIALPPRRRGLALGHAVGFHPRPRAGIRPAHLPTPRVRRRLLRPALQELALRQLEDHLLRPDLRRQGTRTTPTPIRPAATC